LLLCVNINSEKNWRKKEMDTCGSGLADTTFSRGNRDDVTHAGNGRAVLCGGAVASRPTKENLEGTERREAKIGGMAQHFQIPQLSRRMGM
jgi:hypothetical protein